MCWWWRWGDKGHLQLFIELPFLGLLLFLLIDTGLVKDIVFASILEVNWIWKLCVCFISVFYSDTIFLFYTKRRNSHLKIVQLVKFSLSAVLSCHLRHGFAFFPTLFYHFFQVFFTLFFIIIISHCITLFLPRRRMSLIWCCCSSVNWRLLKKSCSQAWSETVSSSPPP